MWNESHYQIYVDFSKVYSTKAITTLYYTNYRIMAFEVLGLIYLRVI